MANESGIREAMKVAGLAPGSDLQVVEPEQDALFAELMEAEAAASADQFGSALKTVKGRGRPKGARNLTTTKTIELILASRRDPLLFLADVVAMAPHEVKALYGCEGAQALGHQIRAAAELAGYIHSKKPTAVKVDSSAFNGPVFIQMGAPGDATPDLVGGQTVEAQAQPLMISNTCGDAVGEVTTEASHLSEESADDTGA